MTGVISIDPAVLAAEMIPPADPELLASRAHLDRIDRKLVLARTELCSLLDAAADLYCAVPANGRHAATYETTYFDTPDMRCFHDHRQGRGRRFKVRVRHHIERALTFLEVKEKTPAGRTRKRREPRPFRSTLDAEVDRAFLSATTPFASQTLAPTVRIDCRRLTLVRAGSPERITIDWDVRFVDPESGRAAALDGLVIAELKSDSLAASPALALLRAAGARELALSKYCVGVCLLDREPAARFGSVLRAVRRVAG